MNDCNNIFEGLEVYSEYKVNNSITYITRIGGLIMSIVFFSFLLNKNYNKITENDKWDYYNIFLAIIIGSNFIGIIINIILFIINEIKINKIKKEGRPCFSKTQNKTLY